MIYRRLWVVWVICDWCHGRQHNQNQSSKLGTMIFGVCQNVLYLLSISSVQLATSPNHQLSGKHSHKSISQNNRYRLPKVPSHSCERLTRDHSLLAKTLQSKFNYPENFSLTINRIGRKMFSIVGTHSR